MLFIGPAETPTSVHALDLARGGRELLAEVGTEVATEILASVNEIVAEAGRDPPRGPEGLDITPQTRTFSQNAA